MNRYPLWVGPRAGLDGLENVAPTGIRSPDGPARSKSLYRLRYPGPLFTQPYQNFELDKAGIHKSPVPGRPDDYILNGDVKCLWAVSMELASCNSGDVWIFQVILKTSGKSVLRGSKVYETT